jgi:hypothetical protein
MERLNPKQVEWLVVNQPETEHKCKYLNYIAIKRSKFNLDDNLEAKLKTCIFWLYAKTYNSLPQTFKDLADATT